MVHNATMIKRPTKAEQRRELEKQMADFLKRGGRVTQVEQGATGLDDGAFGKHHFTIGQPRQTRTAIPEVVAAIEARRKAKQSARTASTHRRRPERKVIYDDFGEPVRVVWTDR